MTDNTRIIAHFIDSTTTEKQICRYQLRNILKFNKSLSTLEI